MVPDQSLFKINMCSDLVGLLRHYSNRPDLCDDLARSTSQLRTALDREAAMEPVRTSVRSAHLKPQAWRLTDRLSGQDIEALVQAFVEGTPKWKLAERYGISLGSVKNLLRERGIRRA